MGHSDDLCYLRHMEVVVSFTNDELLLQLPKLRRFAKKLRGGEDLVQDTVERAIRKRELFVGGDLRKWLFTIMYNVAMSRHRRENGRKEIHASNVEVSYTPVETEVFCREIVREIDKLPKWKRDAIVAATLWGTGNEVSERMNLHNGTLKTRVCRVREKLRKLCV